MVMNVLSETGLIPSRLEIEITETVLISEDEFAFATLKALRSLGARIALDDFGTGYSSLSYLRKLPLDRIKIDGSFIRGFYGPPQTGGGGALDPEDRSILYYANGRTGIAFKLDWASGEYRPSSIYWRPGQKDMEGMPGPAPERCFIVQERP